jgi:hypothetical protein
VLYNASSGIRASLPSRWAAPARILAEIERRVVAERRRAGAQFAGDARKTTGTFGSRPSASYTAEAKATGLHGEYTILSGTGTYDKATGTGSFDAVPTKFKGGATLFNGKFDVKTP